MRMEKRFTVRMSMAEKLAAGVPEQRQPQPPISEARKKFIGMLLRKPNPNRKRQQQGRRRSQIKRPINLFPRPRSKKRRARPSTIRYDHSSVIHQPPHRPRLVPA